MPPDLCSYPISKCTGVPVKEDGECIVAYSMFVYKVKTECHSMASINTHNHLEDYKLGNGISQIKERTGPLKRSIPSFYHHSCLTQELQAILLKDPKCQKMTQLSNAIHQCLIYST